MGYLAVLRSPAMATMTLLSFVSSFVGYSQLNAGMPAYARGVGEVSTRALGFAFAANTLVIVLLQLVVLQRIEGRRRTRVIAVMGVVWAFSWLLLGLSGLVPGTAGATLLVAACASVFAFGETLLQPTIPALVNDLAPDHLRGRYNALSSGSFQLAAVIAPPISGLLIGHALGNVYIGLLVVGCLVCGVVAIARLEPQLDPRVNGVREDETVGRRRDHAAGGVTGRAEDRPQRASEPPTISTDDQRDDDERDQPLLPVGLDQDRQHRRAQVDRVVRLGRRGERRRWRRRGGRLRRPAPARGRGRVGRSRRRPRRRSATDAGRPRPPARAAASRRPVPRRGVAPSRCSRQATNWPSSLSETSCITPAAELRRLAGDGQVGEHLDVGAAATRPTPS